MTAGSLRWRLVRNLVMLQVTASVLVLVGFIAWFWTLGRFVDEGGERVAQALLALVEVDQLDLGAGEADYKSHICDGTDALFDLAVPVTAKGQADGFLIKLAAPVLPPSIATRVRRSGPEVTEPAARLSVLVCRSLSGAVPGGPTAKIPDERLLSCDPLTIGSCIDCAAG